MDTDDNKNEEEDDNEDELLDDTFKQMFTEDSVEDFIHSVVQVSALLFIIFILKTLIIIIFIPTACFSEYVRNIP